MQRRDSPRVVSQRRPRLLRACATEPSIFTTSLANHGPLALAQPNSAVFDGNVSRCTSSRSSSNHGGHRRATDLLNHVAYLASSAVPAISGFPATAVPAATTTPFLDRLLTPRRLMPNVSIGAGREGDSRRHCAGGGGDCDGDGGRSNGHPKPTAYGDGAPEDRRHTDSDDVFGSSPASTDTGRSFDDLLALHPHSANYISFPSFDTWDPDGHEKEDDAEAGDGKLP